MKYVLTLVPDLRCRAVILEERCEQILHNSRSPVNLPAPPEGFPLPRQIAFHLKVNGN